MHRELSPQAADRLAKLLGMLGSSHVGERASAAAFASRLLTDHGWSWQEVVQRAFRAPVPIPPSAPPPRGTHTAVALWALGYRDRLTAREAEFVSSISLRRSLTPRQADWLHDIVGKLRRGGAA